MLLRLVSELIRSGAEMTRKYLGVSGISVFDRGFMRIYSKDRRKFANKTAVVVGVAAVGYVGYIFVRGK